MNGFQGYGPKVCVGPPLSAVVHQHLAIGLAVGEGVNRAGSAPGRAAAALRSCDSEAQVHRILDSDASATAAAAARQAKAVARAAISGDRAGAGQCACRHPDAAAGPATAALPV